MYIYIYILNYNIYIFRGNSLRRVKNNNSNNSGNSNNTKGVHHRKWCNKDSIHLDRKYINSNITATIAGTSSSTTTTTTAALTIASTLTTTTSTSNNSINRLSANLTSVELSPALIAQANWTFVEKLLKVIHYLYVVEDITKYIYSINIVFGITYMFLGHKIQN